MGTPYSGCGVPQGSLVDDVGRALPWVALNSMTVDGQVGGQFARGENCGRWLRIKPLQGCTRGTSGQERVCIIGDSAFQLLSLPARTERR